MKTLRKLNKEEKNSIHLLTTFYQKIYSIFYEITYERNDPDSFYCIPYHRATIIEDLLRLFKVIKNQPDGRMPTFLDVGCGVGHIVALASAIGFNAEGLEYKIPERHAYITVKQGDALEFKGYDKYDVIYCYQIFRNPSKLKQLYDLIVKNAKSGTYILPVGQHDYRSFKNCESIQLSLFDVVYRKK